MRNETQSTSALSKEVQDRYKQINEAIYQRGKALRARYNALHPEYEAEHKAKLKAYNEQYY